MVHESSSAFNGQVKVTAVSHRFALGPPKTCPKTSELAAHGSFEKVHHYAIDPPMKHYEHFEYIARLRLGRAQLWIREYTLN